jgi:hypothetical protein
LRSIKPISDIVLKKQKDLIDLEGYKLIIEKNINLSGENVISDREDLSFYGALYSLENNLKDDLFKLEPIYIRGL